MESQKHSTTPLEHWLDQFNSSGIGEICPCPRTNVPSVKRLDLAMVTLSPEQSPKWLRMFMSRATKVTSPLESKTRSLAKARSEGDYGAAKVMLRPASPGTGVIAGGSVRIVLEMAGVENALGKQLGSNNALNNARATVVAVMKMRQFSEVAAERGIPMEELWK
ncbi:ribosomal protein S5 family protein [Actinidia rufa]|uniref:Ribosomal protein S5 family protein n=1 Tax=Actinidia rufa TaxID=165716 RepID=A0A7J0EZL6_9ERIC|nr:ribosomal protein S5 family protein [Actinidia rufa]